MSDLPNADLLRNLRVEVLRAASPSAIQTAFNAFVPRDAGAAGRERRVVALHSHVEGADIILVIWYTE